MFFIGLALVTIPLLFFLLKPWQSSQKLA